MKLKMNDCLLLIISFLIGWYVCNRYHDRNRLVEGFDYINEVAFIGILFLVTLFALSAVLVYSKFH